jgi:hypothetical protein
VYFSAGVYVHVTRESCFFNIAFFVRHFLPEEYLSYTNFLVNMKDALKLEKNTAVALKQTGYNHKKLSHLYQGRVKIYPNDSTLTKKLKHQFLLFNKSI